MKKIISAFLVAIMFAGCTANETLTAILQKTYSLTTTAQTIVNNASPESFAKIASTLDVSLGFVSSALTYVTPKVTNPKVTEAIVKAQASIVTVQSALKTLTPETMAQTKATVVMSLDVMKTTIAAVSEYFNIPLPVATVKATANADPIKDLQDAASALDKVLPKK